MKKRIALPVICLIAAAALLFAGWSFITQSDQSAVVRESEAADMAHIETLISNGAVEAAVDGEKVSFIDGNFTTQKIVDSSDAAKVLNTVSALFGDSLHANAEDFVTQPYNDGEFQANYYRYCPSVNGVPVLGSQIILSADRDANVTALFSSYMPEIENVDTTAAITPEEAENIAVSELLSGDVMSSVLNNLASENISKEEAMIAFRDFLRIESALVVYALDDTESPRLVYAVSVNHVLHDENMNGKYEITDPAENQDAALVPTVSNTYYIFANGADSGQIAHVTNNIKSVAPQSLTAETWSDITHDFSVRYPNEKDRSEILENVAVREYSLFDTELGKYYSLYDSSRNITTYQLFKIPLLGIYADFAPEVVTASNLWNFPENALWAHYN